MPWFPAWLNLSLADRKALLLPPTILNTCGWIACCLLHYSLSHSNINTFPSFHVPSLLNLPMSAIPRPQKTLMLFWRRVWIKMSLQSEGNQGTSPPGGLCRVCDPNVKTLHTPGSSFHCFSCFDTFFLTTSTWRNTIVPGCARLSPPLTLLRLSHAWRSPGKIWLVKHRGKNI